MGVLLQNTIFTTSKFYMLKLNLMRIKLSLKPLLFVTIFLVQSLISTAQILPLSRNDSGRVANFLSQFNTFNAANNYKEASRMMNEVGFIYWNYNQSKTAITYYEKSLELNKHVENENGIAMIHNNLGMLYADIQEYDKALYHFNQTLATRKSQKEPVSIISSLINCSVVYNNMGNYKASVSSLQDALSLSREMKDTKQMASVYAMLSETYEKMGNVDESLKYFSLYKSFHDQLQKKQITTLSGQLETESLKKQLAQEEAKTKEFELVKSKLAIIEQNTKLTNVTSENKSLYQNLSRKEIEIALQIQETKTAKANAGIVEARNKALEKEQYYIICIILIVSVFIAIIGFIKYSDYKKTKKSNTLLFNQNVAINEQKQQLETSNDVKNKIFTIIGHDLRGPIGSMSSIFKILDTFPLDEKVKEILKIMSTEVKSIYNLLENLLNWAKTQMSELSPVFVKIDLNNLVKENIQLLQPIADTKNIKLINEVPEGLIAVSDAEMTKLVIRNLIQNAIKFTNKGGVVSLTGLKDHAISQLIVQDTGVGMDADKVASLFNIKSNKSTYGTANEKGTGLGLVLCYDFIKLCNGSISVASQVGKGTTITVKLNNI